MSRQKNNVLSAKRDYTVERNSPNEGEGKEEARAHATRMLCVSRADATPSGAQKYVAR